ncbi:MAG: beta-galactosidase trimerization domain-containing protein, partial [Candidatus Latescibacterota bacterium]
ERETVRKYLPDKPYFAYNRNAINIRDVIDQPVRHSIDFLDQELLYDITDGFSADPYPTATLNRDGRARALWHTGFTAKLVTDLAAGKPSTMILQAFAFDGHRPVAENLREWASQAAKAGVTHLEWYTQGNTRFAWPDLYAESLRLSRLWKSMPALDLPKTAEVAVIFSDDSRAAQNDAGLHQYYMLHVLLGEKLGAWFAFTGENHVRRGLQSLDAAKLILAPGLSHVSKAFVSRLAARVKSGATLVILDPDALAWDIETGSLAMERLGLLGASPGTERAASLLRVTDEGRKRFGNLGPLPLQSGKDGVPARSLSALPGATTLFTFGDGAPAMYSRPYGRGEVIVFAARPFGNSELALAPAGWDRLFAALLDEQHIKRNLPIWRFQFPAKGGEVKTYKPLVQYEMK